MGRLTVKTNGKMKNSVSILCLVLLSLSAFSQNDDALIDSKADTTKMNMGNKKMWIFSDKKKGHDGKMHNNLVWTGFDIGINGFMTPGFNPQLQGDYAFMELDYGRSWKFAWNVFEVKAPLNKKKTATFVTGAGFEWNNYSFKQKIALREADDFGPVADGDPVFVDAADPSITYKRTRLQNSWFNIPVMFNFRTVRSIKHKQQFNFTVGAVGGVRMGASQREIFLDGGDRTTNVRRDDFMLNRFRATAMVRMRYSYFSLFGTYTFTPMFKDGAPLVYPWSVGIAISPY